MKTPFRLLFAALLAFGASAATAAPKREHEIDRFVVNPNLSAIRVTAVAMLPAVSYDGVLPAERSAEYELMLKVRDTGYRWVSAATSRDMLRADAPDDSLLKANEEDLLAHDRLDSLRAARICALLRVNGLLTIRVDRAEQVSVQTDQSGKPSTTVQVHAALVDSLGRLVWAASGAQIAEGPDLQATSAGAGGGGFNGLTPTPVTEKNNAPEWAAAYQPMFLRWAPTFPARARMAGGAVPADSSAHAHR